MVDKREVLVQTAMRLFAQGGYTGIGIDRIIAEAGIAKMTLYKYFPSKQDLIMEVLTQRDIFFRTSLMNYVNQQEGHCLLYTSPSPRDQRGSRMPSSA